MARISYTEGYSDKSVIKQIHDLKEDKQEKLIAGDNIIIVDNVISATGGSEGVSKEYVDQQVATRQPLGDYPTRSEMNTALAGKQPIGDYATKTELTQGLAGKQDVGDYATKSELTGGLAGKQDVLVSGTNIKTINGISVLGSGNITIGGSDVTAGYGLYKSGNRIYSTNVGTIVSIQVADDVGSVLAYNIFDPDYNGGVGGWVAHTIDEVQAAVSQVVALGTGTAILQWNTSQIEPTITGLTLNFMGLTRTSGGGEDLLFATMNNDGEWAGVILRMVYDSTSHQYSYSWVKATFPESQMATKTELTQGLAGKQNVLTAGANITIENDVISATGGTASPVWGDITGTLNDQTDLKNALDAKASAADVVGLTTRIGNAESAIAGLDASKMDKVTLATVATTGSYNDLSNKPTIPDVSGLASVTYVDSEIDAVEAQIPDVSGLATKTEVNTGLAGKQDTLVSGTNIKTINGTSVLGSGDITINSGAPHTAQVVVPPTGGAVTVSGMTLGSTVIVSPAPVSYDVYVAAQCRCTTESTGALIFSVAETASASMTVNVIWWSA